MRKKNNKYEWLEKNFLTIKTNPQKLSNGKEIYHNIIYMNNKKIYSWFSTNTNLTWDRKRQILLRKKIHVNRMVYGRDKNDN